MQLTLKGHFHDDFSFFFLLACKNLEILEKLLDFSCLFKRVVVVCFFFVYVFILT